MKKTIKLDNSMSFPSQKQIKSLNNTYELIVINDMSIYATKLNNLKYSNASFIPVSYTHLDVYKRQTISGFISSVSTKSLSYL